jgi:hypothetical protein
LKTLLDSTAGKTPSQGLQAAIDLANKTIAELKAAIEKRTAESDEPKPVKTISVGPDGKPLTELPGVGGAALDAVTPDAITKAVTKAVNDHLKSQPKKAGAVIPDTAAITKAVTEEMAKTSPDATQATINAAITKAIADQMKAPPKKGAGRPEVGAAPAPDSLAALIPQLTKTSDSITLSISNLTTAGNTFSTVFSTGATAISGAGQKAADALTTAAPSIGQTIGNAAAKAIAAATANISVNVNPGTPNAPRGELRATD